MEGDLKSQQRLRFCCFEASVPVWLAGFRLSAEGQNKSQSSSGKLGMLTCDANQNMEGKGNTQLYLSPKILSVAKARCACVWFVGLPVATFQ
eukprot:scaffold217603_cov10-Tisochrysis_lutea.AAC.1